MVIDATGREPLPLTPVIQTHCGFAIAFALWKNPLICNRGRRENRTIQQGNGRYTRPAILARKKNSRKARRSIVSTMSDNDSDSDDEASSDVLALSPRMINHPPTVTLLDTSIAQGDGENLFKNGELEEAKQGISNARIDAQCAVIPKNVAIPHAKNAKKVPNQKKKDAPR